MKHWKVDVNGLNLICECHTSVFVIYAAMILSCVSGKRGMLVFHWLPHEFCYCGSPYMMCLFTLSSKQQEINQYAYSFIIRKSVKVGCDNIQGFSVTLLQLLDNYKLAIPPFAPTLLFTLLTLNLLTWTIWRAPTNASKWRMGFNSAFKGLTTSEIV